MTKATKTPAGLGASTQKNGRPSVSDSHSLTPGADGPVLLHDANLLETMQHFNREKVPERQPHAKGEAPLVCSP